MQIPIDVSILGIVFAVILLIIVFSAIVLYLAFRIKETFREEKKRGIRIAKIGFIIGTLFLAGGILYFFAGALPLTPTPSPSPIPTSTPSPTPNEIGKPNLTMTTSYPTRVKLSSHFTLSFTIVNPSEYTAHSVSIQASVLFESVRVVSSTYEMVGNVIKIGDVPPGTTISSLELAAPERPGLIQDTITLTFKEMSQPITQEISISVTRGP